jgi:hypothetical protein
VIELIGGPERLHSVAGRAGAELSREELSPVRVVVTGLADDGITMEQQRSGRLSPALERWAGRRTVHFGMAGHTRDRAVGPFERQTPPAVRGRIDRGRAERPSRVAGIAVGVPPGVRINMAVGALLPAEAELQTGTVVRVTGTAGHFGVTLGKREAQRRMA